MNCSLESYNVSTPNLYKISLQFGKTTEILNIIGNLLPALNVLNGLPVVLDLALGLGEDLLQLVHLALQLGLKGELHVVECEGASGQLVPAKKSVEGNWEACNKTYYNEPQLTLVQHCPGLQAEGWGVE